MKAKEKYIEFCKTENVPLFSQYWWLDTICGKSNWDVVLIEKGGEIWASMPYFRKKKLFFNFLSMPVLTQKLGPYIRYPKNQKYYKKLSWEKEIMVSLIKQLPNFDFFNQNWDYRYQNWLPFYWHGFKQTTKYTYIIKKDKKIEDIYRNFNSDVKRRINKCLDSNINVTESSDYKKFYEINKKTFEQKGKKIPYSLNLIEKIYESANKHKSVKLLFAKDMKNVYAGAFFVYDKETVYYLMGGIDPDKKDVGTMNLLIYEGIKFAIKNNMNFDFEGSMIEPIEKYFRSFGPFQYPYYNIYKENNIIIKTIRYIRNLKE